MVVGGSVIRDTEEPSNECPVGGYHQWDEVRSALAHVCALCGRVSPVARFEHSQPTPLPQHRTAPAVTPAERQAS